VSQFVNGPLHGVLVAHDRIVLDKMSFVFPTQRPSEHEGGLTRNALEDRKGAGVLPSIFFFFFFWLSLLPSSPSRAWSSWMDSIACLSSSQPR
jgi:hypothetical protein